MLVLLLTVAFLSPPTVSAAGCQVLSKSSLEKKAKRYKKTIRSASAKYGVHEDLIKAVITVESCFRRKARGSLGEKGLMQLMPSTARRFKVRRGYNAWENVHGGTRYLSYLLKRYRGDTRRAVAAYNAGEGNVKPGRRIRNIGYVKKVMRAYHKLSGGKKRVKSLSTRKAKARKASRKKRKLTRKEKRLINRHHKSRKKSARKTSRKSFLVRKGHTVYEVMRQTGVPVKKIIRLNKLKAPYHIKTGQRLRLR